MFRTVFIAVTGSFGKTTAKDCLAAALCVSGRVVKAEGNANGRAGIIRTILKVRPWDRWAVLEAGTERPGNLWRGSLLIRPDVVLILRVGRAHTKSLRTLEDVAAEKARLLRFLRRGGTAVLNQEDPYVARMGTRRGQRVVWFGGQAGSHLRYSEVEGDWPDRLRFTAEWEGQRQKVETSLVGEHRAVSVAGALAAAAALGIPLTSAAEAVRGVQPHTARLAPAELPNGAVVLRDEANGSIDSLQAALEVLRTARARRRILILSDVSDWSKKPRERMQFFARAAKRCADMAVFLGERSHYAVRHALKEGMPPEAVHGFLRWQDAATFLRGELRQGDLVLLRGLTYEHLSRLYFSLTGTIECEKLRCERHRGCDDCPSLGFRALPQRKGDTACAE